MQLVRELARILPDHSIAPLLNRLGIRSARGQSWTQLRVRNFRGVHQIAIYRDGERAERHELILHEAAGRRGVHKMTIVRLIRDGRYQRDRPASAHPMSSVRMIWIGRQYGARSLPVVQYHWIRSKKACPFNKITRSCIMSPFRSSIDVSVMVPTPCDTA